MTGGPGTVWARVLERVQSLADADGEFDWVVSVDSTIACVHQHGMTLARDTGGSVELKESGRAGTT